MIVKGIKLFCVLMLMLSCVSCNQAKPEDHDPAGQKTVCREEQFDPYDIKITVHPLQWLLSNPEYEVICSQKRENVYYYPLEYEDYNHPEYYGVLQIDLNEYTLRKAVYNRVTNEEVLTDLTDCYDMKSGIYYCRGGVFDLVHSTCDLTEYKRAESEHNMKDEEILNLRKSVAVNGLRLFMDFGYYDSERYHALTDAFNEDEELCHDYYLHIIDILCGKAKVDGNDSCESQSSPDPGTIVIRINPETYWKNDSGFELQTKDKGIFCGQVFYYDDMEAKYKEAVEINLNEGTFYTYLFDSDIAEKVTELYRYDMRTGIKYIKGGIFDFVNHEYDLSGYDRTENEETMSDQDIYNREYISYRHDLMHYLKGLHSFNRMSSIEEYDLTRQLYVNDKFFHEFVLQVLSKYKESE